MSSINIKKTVTVSHPTRRSPADTQQVADKNYHALFPCAVFQQRTDNKRKAHNLNLIQGAAIK